MVMLPVNCATGAVTQGVLVERIMAATEPARMKLVILDACRDNPLGEVCPNLAGKATAMFSAFEANPGIYFEQVFNEVARATYEAAQKQGGFLQIPGKVVSGVAPADCLAGKNCIGDTRMAALATENERLAATRRACATCLRPRSKHAANPIPQTSARSGSANFRPLWHASARALTLCGRRRTG